MPYPFLDPHTHFNTHQQVPQTVSGDPPEGPTECSYLDLRFIRQQKIPPFDKAIISLTTLGNIFHFLRDLF